jgi:hypothetical protein
VRTEHGHNLPFHETTMSDGLTSIGRTPWAISDRWIRAGGHGSAPEMTSHDTVFLLNGTDWDARVTITVYFDGREPAGPYRLAVPAHRTMQVRFSDLAVPNPIPRGADFVCAVASDVPIVVQHTGFDGPQPEAARTSDRIPGRWLG